MNRFSSDTATVDDSLPFILNILLANLAALAGILAVLAYSQPLLLVSFLPLAIVYRSVCRGYAIEIYHSLFKLPLIYCAIFAKYADIKDLG